MAEIEPGHPNELLERLNNWVNRANDPIGLLPPNVTPTEWAVRNFIDTWRKPIRAGIGLDRRVAQQGIDSTQVRRRQSSSV
jgi:hypothetical protein